MLLIPAWIVARRSLDSSVEEAGGDAAPSDGEASDGEMSFRVWALDGGRGSYDPASIAFSTYVCTVTIG